MAVVIVFTNANYVSTPMDSLVITSNESLPLLVNTRSSFTLHHAIWPFVGLISLIATVWFLVYISTMYSRHHRPKNEQQNFASLYLTQDSTVGGRYETSVVISAADV